MDNHLTELLRTVLVNKHIIQTSRNLPTNRTRDKYVEVQKIILLIIILFLSAYFYINIETLFFLFFNVSRLPVRHETTIWPPMIQMDVVFREQSLHRDSTNFDISRKKIKTAIDVIREYVKNIICPRKSTLQTWLQTCRVIGNSSLQANHQSLIVIIIILLTVRESNNVLRALQLYHQSRNCTHNINMNTSIGFIVPKTVFGYTRLVYKLNIVDLRCTMPEINTVVLYTQT